MLMAQKSIRHIPVKNSESGELIGFISQKVVLSNAIKIINQRGLENLEHQEKSMPIASIMDTNPYVFDINQNLLDVANCLLEKKAGCVAITENKKIVGVISSNDFVKLAVTQLGPSTC